MGLGSVELNNWGKGVQSVHNPRLLGNLVICSKAMRGYEYGLIDGRLLYRKVALPWSFARWANCVKSYSFAVPLVHEG